MTGDKETFSAGILLTDICYCTYRFFTTEAVRLHWKVVDPDNWRNVSESAARSHNITPFDVGALLAMKGLFANWPDEFLNAVGYQLSDIMVDCVFDGEPCVKSDFTLIKHEEFFNCYTFRLKEGATARPGPEAGLNMILYIGEFLKVSLVTANNRIHCTFFSGSHLAVLYESRSQDCFSYVKEFMPSTQDQEQWVSTKIHWV